MSQLASELPESRHATGCERQSMSICLIAEAASKPSGLMPPLGHKQKHFTWYHMPSIVDIIGTVFAGTTDLCTEEWYGPVQRQTELVLLKAV